MTDRGEGRGPLPTRPLPAGFLRGAPRLFSTVLLAGLAVLLPAKDTLAQVDGAHFRLGPYLGYTSVSKYTNLENAFLFGARGGFWPNGIIGLEGHVAFLNSETERGYRRWIGTPGAPSWDQSAVLYGANIVVNPGPYRRLSGYLLGGWQEARFGDNDRWPEVTYQNGLQVGGGLMGWATPKLAVRAEVRDIFWNHHSSPPAPDPPGTDWTSNVVFSLGAEYAFGGWDATRDSDLDGVVDRRDRCPDTPRGARVDVFGCPVDSDRDGVPDGLDHCPRTPFGARVDSTGCAGDSDGDGVPDGLDRCPGTPAGARTDRWGCFDDSDGDGVADGLDQCPNTSAGAQVDSRGCPIDSDGDGVPDGVDRCPSTPRGARVDASGCPITVSQRETELFDTGRITARDILFETARWEILPQSRSVLEEIGSILVQWPQLRIEIGGHADARGSDSYNRDLSEKRANAVRQYLLSRFPQIRAEQYTAVGYGESQPVAPNTTVEGMALNRRVEFKVLNQEELRKVREQRQTVPR